MIVCFQQYFIYIAAASAPIHTFNGVLLTNTPHNILHKALLSHIAIVETIEKL